MLSNEQLSVLQQDLAMHYANGKLLADPVVDAYLVELKDILITDPRIYIAANVDISPNAFATWGSLILFNTGIIDFVNAEGELAGILAHEIAHLKLHHFTRLKNNTQEFSGLTIASVFVALLSGSNFTSELIAGASALEQSKQLELRRRYEREADQKAATYLAKSGLPLNEYVSLLSRLSPETSLPKYAASHPFGAERISELTAKLRQFPASGKNNKERELDFWLVQERVRKAINSTNQSAAPEQWQPIVAAYRTVINNESIADSTKQMLQEHQEHWIVALALAKHAIENEQLQEARGILDKALQKWPGKQVLVVRKLEVLTMAGDFPAAQLLLAGMPPELRDTPLMAMAELRLWQKMGNDFRYRVTVSYSHYLTGKITAAKSLIKLAQKMPEASQTSFSAGRLALLERKIERLEKIIESNG